MAIASKPAHSIPVADFRMVFQWPLLLEPETKPGDGAAPRDRIRQLADSLETGRTPWRRVRAPAHYPPPVEGESGDSAPHAYGQSVYFHDFVRDFLFDEPGSDASARREVTVFERTDASRLQVWSDDNAPTMQFAIDRVSLHLFSIGVAVFTLELRWQGFVGDDERRLMLADCQTTINLLRRSFVPYVTNDGTCGDVPAEVVVIRRGADVRSAPQKASRTLTAVKDNQPVSRWPQCFSHWAELIAPLTLASAGGDWRDPADERIALNSFIRLATRQEGDAPPSATQYQATLLAISESDWHRLAEADSAGDGWAYNAGFLKAEKSGCFYDRFFPSAGCEKCATRHIFGPSHYCVVSAGEFAEDFLHDHFRRHYALIGLIVRLEEAVLLSLSRRLSKATARLNAGGGGAGDDFEKTVIDIHGDFLRFCHRYRFTGVSNQIQPTEMLEKWRRSMRLDDLFHDVEGELAAAFQRITAMQQKRESEAAVDLSRLAGGAALLVLVVTLGEDEIRKLIPITEEGTTARLLFYLGGIMVLLPLAACLFGVRSQGFLHRLMWLIFLGVGLTAAACLLN